VEKQRVCPLLATLFVIAGKTTNTRRSRGSVHYLLHFRDRWKNNKYKEKQRVCPLLATLFEIAGKTTNTRRSRGSVHYLLHFQDRWKNNKYKEKQRVCPLLLTVLEINGKIPKSKCNIYIQNNRHNHANQVSVEK
jgi:hypothetical protein